MYNLVYFIERFIKFIIKYKYIMTQIEIKNKNKPYIYYENPMKLAIKNNDPIEEKLHVVIMMSNPCNFKKRIKLTKEFIHRMEHYEENIILYIVEYIYPGQSFQVTDSKNPRHLQIQTNTNPLWHKENALNLGIQNLLPSDWKCVAWIDADIEFESSTWAIDTLKILNGTSDIVQLFSYCNDMDELKNTMNIAISFGYQYIHKKDYETTGKTKEYWHPGYAWACTRKAYEKMGKLYENGILGSGDHIMALSFIKNCEIGINENYNIEYINDMKNFEKRTKNLRLGYTPGIIKHYFHGSKINRKYQERWKLLIKHDYNPLKHITNKNDSPLTNEKESVRYYNDNKIIIDGIMKRTKETPEELLKDIMKYFKERNEDE